MNSLPKKLIALIGSTALLFSFGVLLTQLVQYKPWGVPDVRRSEYEEKLRSISARNNAIESFSDKPHPIQSMTERLHDFGYVSNQVSLTHAFELKNMGQAPLRVLKAEMPAGANYQLVPKTVSAGQTGRLIVRWSPSIDQKGEQAKLKFTTNDPIDPQFTLTLSAKEKKKIVLPNRIDLGVSDPSESLQASVVVYSQLASEIEITDVNCDAPNFFWNFNPIDHNRDALRKQSATAGLELLVGACQVEFGKFSVPCEITMKIDGEVITENIELFGRVRTPITFDHPDMRRDRGLDIGSFSSDQKHQVYVQVRLRGEDHRKLEVLDSKPEELQVELIPLKRQGTYKMAITIPEGCPTIQFNRDDFRGFIKVGDPTDRNFSNWLPLYGAVVSLK